MSTRARALGALLAATTLCGGSLLLHAAGEPPFLVTIADPLQYDLRGQQPLALFAHDPEQEPIHWFCRHQDQSCLDFGIEVQPDPQSPGGETAWLDALNAAPGHYLVQLFACDVPDYQTPARCDSQALTLEVGQGFGPKMFPLVSPDYASPGMLFRRGIRALDRDTAQLFWFCEYDCGPGLQGADCSEVGAGFSSSVGKQTLFDWTPPSAMTCLFSILVSDDPDPDLGFTDRQPLTVEARSGSGLAVQRMLRVRRPDAEYTAVVREESGAPEYVSEGSQSWFHAQAWGLTDET